MKLNLLNYASSFMLSFAIGSVAEAATVITPPPVPTELLEYIEMAETGTLPDPLDPNKLVLWSGGGERFTFVERVEDTNGKFSLFDIYIPPGNGPMLHIHTRENEWFYVVEGNVSIQRGDDLFAYAEPGTLLYGPANVRHNFKNQTSEPARMLLFYLPVPDEPDSVGSIEQLFIDAGYEVIDPINPPEMDMARFMRLAIENHGFIIPNSFVFANSEFTGNDITIRRNGMPHEAVSVVLDVGNGLEIPVNFGMGEVLQTVTLPSEVGNQFLNLTLTNPSEGSFIGLIEHQAVRITVPESSYPFSLLAFGLLGTGLIITQKRVRV